MAPRISADTRTAQLDRLADTTLDLIVVGGGITGAGIAWEAALRGLSVALFERGDFASGTSSKSSKLLHGGLRYLEQAEVKLVFESLAERNRLFHDAPHVAQKLPFLFPIFAGGRDKSYMIGPGLWLYDVLSAISSLKETKWHERLSPKAAIEEVPALRRDGLRRVYRYMDGLTEDARLVVETIKSAVAAGAIALNYTAVTGFLRDAQGQVAGVTVHDALGDRSVTVRARRVFNAAGPWVDAVRRMDEPQARPRLRPTKGVHILTEAFVSDHAVVMRSASPDEKKPRVLFVIPYGGRTLIGTTDTDHVGPENDARYLDEDVHASPAEVRYLLDAVNQTFEVRLTEADVISAYAGWRPLVAPPEAGLAESAVSREYEVFASPSGLFSIAGGKLTAYRSMAMHAVAEVVASLGRTDLKPSAIESKPLSGSELGDDTLAAYVQRARQGAPWPAEMVGTLALRYGTNWPDLRRLLEADASLAEPIPGLSPDQPHWSVEAIYALEHEGAVTLADFLMRRTRLHLLDANQALDAAAPVAARMAAWLAPKEGWDAAAQARWQQHQVALYEAEVARDRAARAGTPSEA